MIAPLQAARYAKNALRRLRRTSILAARAARGTRALYLTFDDGPTDYTPQILDLLAAHNAKATFFVVGENITDERFPFLVRALHEGHAVGSHSWSHADFARCSADVIDPEIRLTDEALSRVYAAAGEGYEPHPRLFRFPYLRQGNGASKRAAWAALSEMGYRAVSCDIDPADWKLPLGTITPEEVEQRVLSAQIGDIVLLHETEYVLPLLERVLPYFAQAFDLRSIGGPAAREGLTAEKIGV